MLSLLQQWLAMQIKIEAAPVVHSVVHSSTPLAGSTKFILVPWLVQGCQKTKMKNESSQSSRLAGCVHVICWSTRKLQLVLEAELATGIQATAGVMNISSLPGQALRHILLQKSQGPFHKYKLRAVTAHAYDEQTIVRNLRHMWTQFKKQQYKANLLQLSIVQNYIPDPHNPTFIGFSNIAKRMCENLFWYYPRSKLLITQ